MERGRVTVLATGWCLGLVVALSAIVPASAAEAWKVRGLLYRSRTVNVAGGTEGSGYLPCGARDIVSGGVAVSGPSAKVRVNGLVPDGSNDAWFSFVDVLGSRQRSFRSFAICSKGTFDYVTQDYFPVAPGEIGSGIAICGAGQEAVGGGEAPPVGYGDSRVIESSSGLPSRWTFAWRNTSDLSHAFAVQVTCKQGWELRRARATENVKPRRVGVATASCRGREHVVGGGAAVVSDDVAYLAASRPVDGRDRDRAPDDGWRAVLDSASDTTARVEALAICRR